MNPSSFSVCHVSSVHRGVEIRIVRKQLATLAQAGYRARLVIPATASEVAEMSGMGITTSALAEYTGGEFGRMTLFAAKAIAAARSTRSDLYHFHDPELIPYALWLKALGHKVIMDVHEDLPGNILYKQWIRPSIRGLVSRTAQWIERFGARRFDAVVAAVPYLGDMFRPYARRTVVVGNFPFLDELAQTAGTGEWRARRKIAYVGSISRLRGIVELVDALPQVDVRLQLAGRFMHRQESDEVAVRPGWPWVENRGFVGRAEIRDILATSFAGLCTLHPTPSHLIAEPIKLFEYMAAGIPVISANIPYYEQIVRDADCGLCVDPTDVGQIAQAIRYLRDHPEHAERMGRNGRERVISRYNWNREAEKLLDLYRDVLGAEAVRD